MEDITEENIDQLVEDTEDPDALQELASFAVKFERDDLLEAIIDKSIQNNQLIKKLQEFDLSSMPTTKLFDD